MIQVRIAFGKANRLKQKSKFDSGLEWIILAFEALLLTIYTLTLSVIPTVYLAKLWRDQASQPMLSVTHARNDHVDPSEADAFHDQDEMLIDKEEIVIGPRRC